MELNKIYQMDCIEGMKQLPDKSIDVVITDPPYKIEGGGGAGRMRSGIFHRNKGGRQLFNYEKAEGYMCEIQRVSDESAHIYVFSNDKNLFDIIAAGLKCNLKLMNVIVLDKGNKVAFGWYMKQVEFVVLFRNKGKSKQVRDMSVSNLIEVNFPKGKKRVHPSEKSVDLIELFINQSSNEGGTVLDCFMGSGTTAVSAMRTNRNFIGFEIESEYIQIAQNRIADTKELMEQGDLFTLDNN